jgi:hypothetical protein
MMEVDWNVAESRRAVYGACRELSAISSAVSGGDCGSTAARMRVEQRYRGGGCCRGNRFAVGDLSGGGVCGNRR